MVPFSSSTPSTMTLVSDGSTAILSVIRRLGANYLADAFMPNAYVTGRQEAD
jgi:hypothetical protein